MGRDIERLHSWRRDYIRRVSVDFHKVNDKEMLEWIEKKPNKREYIISLIKKDMEKDQ